MLLLGDDMLVVGKPPAKFTKALAAIASVLHPAFDQIVPPGRSKESCVLCSLTVRDFLWRVGFKDARLVTVYMAIRALDRDDVEIHSVGVGDHNGTVPTLGGRTLQDTDQRWSGHMVVEVPSAGYIVDATLYQALRPAWPHLKGMMAVPIERGGERSFELEHLAGVGAAEEPDGSAMAIWWLLQPNERWRGAPDTDKSLRAPVVKALVQAFGRWSD